MLLTKEIILFGKSVSINEVSKKSHKEVEVKCDNCGRIKFVTFHSYNISTNNNTEKYYCNNKECINKKRKLAIQEKYNVDNVSQLESVKLKKIETSLTNYGVEYPIQSDKIKEKIKDVNNEKYGKDWITQTDNFKEKSKITNLEKYGTESAMQSNIIKDKVKKTCSEKYGEDSYMKTEEFKDKTKAAAMEKYGVDHFSKSDEIQNKIVNTNLEKYGFRRPTESQEIKEKIVNTFIENFGVDNPNKLQFIRDKIKETNLEKYNSEFYSQSDVYKNIVKERKISLLSDKYSMEIKDIENGIITLKCEKCCEEFEANYQLLYNRFLFGKTLCTNCNPVDSLSDSEIQLRNFIKDNYEGEIITNDRNIIKPYELDIFLPEFKIAIEFNGLFWHSELYRESDYHLMKTKMCEKLGIQLIHVFEDDWLYKQDIVKSIILIKLGVLNKIYARECVVKEIVDKKIVREFLDLNHIHGYNCADINIGLFYNENLVSVVSFRNSKNDEYEMFRFCNKINYNIVGGIEKMLNYFTDLYNFKKIINYVDRSYFNIDNFLKIGFKLDGTKKPNYFYIVNGKREIHYNYRKKVLIKQGFDKNKSEQEIMKERKIYRIYNSGSFILKLLK